MEEQKLAEYKKNNIKIYKFYRIFSWDLLFYYAIIYLFLTVEKGLTPAQFLMFDAYYIFFKFIVQIPCTLMIQKFGKRDSIVFANLIGIIHILLIIFAVNYQMLILSQLLCAVTFIIKGTCESDMLYDSLEHNEERGNKFAKIDGKANSKYYYVDAISAIISGFLFVISPYIPMILCCATLIITYALSFRFREIHQGKNKMHIREEIRILREGIRGIIRSRRLMCLVLFNAVVVGMFKILQNVRNTALLDAGLPEQYFGIVFAILGIVTGVFARCQGRIHKRHRNKTLGYISLPSALSCALIGLVLILNIPAPIGFTIIILLLIRIHSNKGPYHILIKKYLNNFTNSEKRIRIATINNIFENGIASILLFGAAIILDKMQTSFTIFIIGCIFMALITLLLDYMREKVGLKPDEYSAKEILKND